MEKLIYVFWNRKGEPVDEVRHRLLRDVREDLESRGASRLQINIADLAEHEAGIPRMGRTVPLPDGMVSFWLSSAWRRAPLEERLASLFDRVAGYSVVESTVMPNRAHPPAQGERSWGFSQLALLHVPPNMTFDAWRSVWFNQHTPVAVTTQSNFRYVQNVVVQPLTADAPAWRGIVEESYPIEAIRDPYVFFDAVNDEAKFQRNLQAVMGSVGRFLEPDGTDLVRTSEYVLHSDQEPAL